MTALTAEKTPYRTPVVAMTSADALPTDEEQTDAPVKPTYAWSTQPEAAKPIGSSKVVDGRARVWFDDKRHRGMDHAPFDW